MKTIIAVVCLVLVGVVLYIDTLRPIQTQREYYDDNLRQYANGISA